MNIQEECSNIHSKYGMSEMANYKIQLLFDSEIEEVKKEYEEKLRWIPTTEKLPEDCPELFLKKCMSKNVLVKRKWNDTGEIVIEINSRFSPSERIGFLWNYDYKDSEVIEWRSII